MRDQYQCLNKGCARKYPCVRSSRNQEVSWVQPVDAKNGTIFGQSVAAVERVLGMQAFREKYVEKENLRDNK